PAGPGRSARTGLAVAATRSRLAPGRCDDQHVNLVTLADVEAARKLIDGVVRYTPLEPSRPLTELLGGPVWLKCENLQRAGSYKVRGAYVRIARLCLGERARGGGAGSAGRHAQGVGMVSGRPGRGATGLALG